MDFGDPGDPAFFVVNPVDAGLEYGIKFQIKHPNLEKFEAAWEKLLKLFRQVWLSSILKFIVCQSWLWADLGFVSVHVCRLSCAQQNSKSIEPILIPL